MEKDKSVLCGNVTKMSMHHQHYLHGKKETIDVISDCMTSDEFHGYLKR